jgi:hypothetical protein
MWLIDDLPKQFEGARIMTYGFDTKLRHSRSNQGIDVLAQNLRVSLQDMRAGTSISVSSGRKPKIVFIAHSLGGLVVKEVAHHRLL